MPIRKKGNIEVKTSPNGYRIERTGYTFYSYDKNSAALVFTFIDSDNAPVNLSKADVQLLLISDNGDEFPVDKNDIDVISAVRGTARYVIPENLLGYEGKITGHIYLDFEDGSHTDEGKFTFNIKRSAITDLASEFGKQYVQDFEDVKERVEQAGDSATKDIEKAKDNAESQIGEYVGEVESAKDNAESQIGDYAGEIESAKQDISSSASDVQSTADKATSDIKSHVDAVENAKNSTVGDIEKAKDNAESQIGDYVGEVKKAKTDAIKSMSESDISDKNYLLDSKKRVLEERSTGRPEDNANYAPYYLSEPIPAGTEFTVSGKLEITDGDFDAIAINFKDENDENVGNSFNYADHSGGEFSLTLTLPRKAYRMAIYAGKYGETRGNGVIYESVKLQLGSIATPWTPNPHEIVTQDQYDKLANAIINLGGNI